MYCLWETQNSEYLGSFLEVDNCYLLYWPYPGPLPFHCYSFIFIAISPASVAYVAEIGHEKVMRMQQLGRLPIAIRIREGPDRCPICARLTSGRHIDISWYDI